MLQANAARPGLALALLSAATFGTSGTFARALIDAGWSPGAAVTVGSASPRSSWPSRRSSCCAAGWHVLRRNLGMIADLRAGRDRRLPGLLLQRRPAPVGRGRAAAGVHGHRAGRRLAVDPAAVSRPRRLTIAGSAVAVVGLVLVLDLIGDAQIDFVGVLWGLGAAVGLAVFFILSARSDSELPPLAMASGGMTIGAIDPARARRGRRAADAATTTTSTFAGHQVSWLVPVARPVGDRRRPRLRRRHLGGPHPRSKLASFVGLTEVLFAVLFAWLFLGQLPTVMQLVGGVLIVAGVALVRIDELREPGTIPISCPVRRLWASLAGVPEPRPTTLPAGRIRGSSTGSASARPATVRVVRWSSRSLVSALKPSRCLPDRPPAGCLAVD